MSDIDPIQPETPAGGEASGESPMTMEEARRRWGWVRPRRGGAPSALSEEQWLCAMMEAWAGATDEECALRWRVHPRTFAMQRRKRGLAHEDRMKPVTPQPWRGREAPPPPVFEGPSPAASVRLARAQERLEAAAVRAEIEAAEEALPAPPTLREAQKPPEGEADKGWRTWLFLGGRGAGKTLARAAWLAAKAQTCRRLALVGPALLDVREVMVEGPSGLRGLGAAFGPPPGLPRWEASRRRLLFPNGAIAYAFSAEDPDSLRGPQFEAAWADEVCAWPRPEETLALLRMGLRLGSRPRLVLTTTPKPRPFLRRLLAEEGLVESRGSAAENAEHLAPGFVAGLRALYGGTRLERQEVDGEVLEAAEGGLFRAGDLARARALGQAAPRPDRFERLVVAVDPPAGVNGSACGIVVVGRTAGRAAAVLEDATVQGLTPGGWAARVADAAERAAALGPVEVVAEANQGGEMVRQVLTGAGLRRPLRLVRATLGKRERAEPVALLYEQGRVAHAPGLGALEDQLVLLGGEDEPGRGESPDRADALVWALTELLVKPPSPGPRIRVL